MVDEVTKLGVHEKECALRFKAIEERLVRGSQRMDRMEMSICSSDHVDCKRDPEERVINDD